MVRTPNARTVRAFGVRVRHFGRAEPNRPNAFERVQNAERRSQFACHILNIFRLFRRKYTFYRQLNNILVIYKKYYFYYIQFHSFASINSHALTAAPPTREAPEDPSTQTKAKIFGIFPFLAAYITDFYSLQARRAPQRFPGRSASGTAARTERKFGSVFGKKRARTEPNRTVATLVLNENDFLKREPFFPSRASKQPVPFETVFSARTGDTLKPTRPRRGTRGKYTRHSQVSLMGNEYLHLRVSRRPDT
jgi:hypothetical protein